MTNEQALELALRYHKAGRLAEAENLYRQLLASQPRHDGALHFLGMIAHQSGKSHDAAELIQQAIAINPHSPLYHCNLGLILTSIGQLDQAIDSLRRAVELQPAFAAAYYNLGDALALAGRSNEAIDAYRAALAQQPFYPEAWSNLGVLLLLSEKESDEPILALRTAVQQRPDFADAWYKLGVALRARKETTQAIEAFQQAIRYGLNSAVVYSDLAAALLECGHFAAAAESIRKSLQLAPNEADSHFTLGLSLYRLGQLNEAIATFRTALDLRPDFAEVLSSLGAALHSRGDYDEAEACHRKAISINPDFAQAHHNLSVLLRLKGDYEHAWPEYEWRWKVRQLDFTKRNFSQPIWDGADLNGRTILLHYEQGIGDTIQFCRYAPLIAQRGGRVLLAPHAELLRLMQSLKGVDRVLRLDAELPAFDVHCPLASLPLLFTTTLQTIPTATPYLHAETELSRRWRARLSETTGPKVGLVWKGRSTHLNDRNRSMTLETLLPLLQVNGVQFISLQKDPTAHDSARWPAILDWTDELADFADTAALIDNLDLVISVDTAVAHLAGAMGKPVWIMLPFVPDWRWMLKRDDSPWYPTARLFRQEAMGQWNPVILRIATLLQERADSGIA